MYPAYTSSKLCFANLSAFQRTVFSWDSKKTNWKQMFFFLHFQECETAIGCNWTFCCSGLLQQIKQLRRGPLKTIWRPLAVESLKQTLKNTIKLKIVMILSMHSVTLIAKTGKEQAENIKSLPRYCPVVSLTRVLISIKSREEIAHIFLSLELDFHFSLSSWCSRSWAKIVVLLSTYDILKTILFHFRTTNAVSENCYIMRSGGVYLISEKDNIYSTSKSPL